MKISLYRILAYEDWSKTCLTGCQKIINSTSTFYLGEYIFLDSFLEQVHFATFIQEFFFFFNPEKHRKSQKHLQYWLK